MDKEPKKKIEASGNGHAKLEGFRRVGTKPARDISKKQQAPIGRPSESSPHLHGRWGYTGSASSAAVNASGSGVAVAEETGHRKGGSTPELVDELKSRFVRADKSTVVRTIITMPLDDTVPPTWISVALVGKADIGLQQIEEILEVQRRLAQLSLMRIKVLLAGPNAEFAMESLSKDWERWSGGAKGWRKVWAPALDIGFGRASATHTHTHLATMLERVETIEESKGEIVRAYFGDSAVNAFVAKPLAEKIDWPKLPFPKAIDGK